jgi:hypothetical protein
MEEKYHVVVTLGYFVVVAIIISVLRAPMAERLALWVIAAIFFASVLRLIRKGIDPPKHFD